MDTTYFLKRHGNFDSPIHIDLDREEVDVGRKPTPLLKSGPNVSRNHARFFREASGQWFVKDLNSLNGVFLNGSKIGSGLYSVKCGDLIGLGAASGQTEYDYVFIFCSYHDSISGTSVHVASNGECSSNRDSISVSTPSRSNEPNTVSSNFSTVQIKQEETEINGNSETISHPTVIKQEKLDPAINEPDDKRAAGRAQNLCDSSLHFPTVDIKSNHCENALILPKGASEASSSSTDIQERNNLPPLESVNRGGEKCDVEQVLQLKQLKIVVQKYDDILIETYNVEKRDTENNVETTSSDVIAPCKRRRRIRIDSSSDGENDHHQKTSEIQGKPKETEVQQSQKSIFLESSLKSCGPQSDVPVVCKHSDEILPPKQHSRKLCIDSLSSGSGNVTDRKGPSKFQSKLKKTAINSVQKSVRALSPIIKSCATESTFAFKNSALSSQCYTQEDEVIVISSDDDDENYVKNQFSVKIKAELVEDEDLANSEWSYVSSSQETYEQDIKYEGLFDLEKSKGTSSDVLISKPIHECISGTDGCPGDAKDIEIFEWDHNEEPKELNDEDHLNSCENVENIKKFLDSTNNKNNNNNSGVPKTYSGHSKLVASLNNGENDFFPPFTESLFSEDPERSDENSDCDQSEFEHRNKIGKHFPERNKKPVFSEKESKLSGRITYTRNENGKSTFSENNKKPLSCNISKKFSLSKRDSTVLENKEKHLHESNKIHTSKIDNCFENKASTSSGNSKNHNSSKFSKTFSEISEQLLPPESDAHLRFYEKLRAHPHEEVEKESSSGKDPEIALRDFCRRQKEKPVNRTEFIEPLPVLYRPRKQRGREEWFRDQYEKDKIIVDKDAQKRTSRAGSSDTSKNKGQKATADKSVLSPAKKKESKYEATTKGKKIKNSSKPNLRKQMQNMYNPISFHTAPSPAVVLASTKQTQSTKQVDVSLTRKRSSSRLADHDAPAVPVKERKVKNRERFKNSRMSFLTDQAMQNDTDQAVQNGTDHQSSTNIVSLRKRKVSGGDIKKSDSTKHNIIRQNGQNRDGAELSGVCSPKVDSTGSRFSVHHHESVLGSHSSATRPSDSCPSDPHHLGYKYHIPKAKSTDLHDRMQPPFQTFSSSSSSISKLKNPEAPNRHVSWEDLPSQTLDPQYAQGPSFPAANLSAAASTEPHHQQEFKSLAFRKNSAAAPSPDATPQRTSQSDGHSSASHLSDPRMLKRSSNIKHNSMPHSATGNSAVSGSNPVAQRVAAVVPRRSVLVDPIAKSTVKSDQHTFILKILNWMPAWLWEQQSRHDLPPVVDWTRIHPLKLSYESADDYILSFYNLLLIEMWECLSQEWKKSQLPSEFRFVVVSSMESGEVLSLNCETLFSIGKTRNLVERTLLIIDLRIDGNQCIQLFAYVSVCKFHNNPGISHLHSELRKLSSAVEGNSSLCKFTLQIKKKKFSICKNKLMKANVFAYIAPQVRVVNSLLSVHSSPLIKDILCPQIKNCTIVHAVHANMPILGRFSKKQTAAIITISDEMRKVYPVPRILLLQGPPGTGKTHVIIGIIQHLLSKKHEKIKILVAAPSNAAADEIGRRLIQLRNKQSECKIQPLRFVRVGIPKQVHLDVAKFSVDSIVHYNFRKKWCTEIEKTKAMLFENKAQINSIKQEIDSMKLNNAHHAVMAPKFRSLQTHERRAAYNKDLISGLKNKTVYENSSVYYEAKLNTLKNADVVLSTLSSCRQGILETAFGKKSDVHFTCCIIDEASQCTEPELLQPLAYGVCKLLLVGDHKQLPATVHSRICVQNHLDRSLFERFHLHFESTLGHSPVFMLTEQYRMHAEICSFPSKHFYSELLKTPPEVNEKYKNFPLKPYFFLNIPYCEESNWQTSKTNDSEAEIIISLCQKLLYVCPRDCSIGVITPYHGQRSIYQKALSKHIDNEKIEVNTVDSFQGREKDIIVMSCVRAHSPDGNIGFLSSQKRLNVAITRASKCLIMCGHAYSLEQQSDWDALIADAKQRNVLISVTSVDDVPVILEEMKNKF